MKKRVDSQGKEYSIPCAQSHQETQSSDTGVLQGSGRTPVVLAIGLAVQL
jgi:hypothetical protein